MSGDALNIPEILRAFEAGYPLGRIGTVDDVAEGGLTLRRNPTVTEMGAAYAQATAHLSA